MSGMLLWSTAYTSSNEEKQEDLLKKLISLADDKIMSVRRIFAMMLADIFDLLGAQCFYNRIFDTAIHLFNDPLDSVKMSNIISFTILMPKMKDKVDESTKVFNLLRELSGDKSWRVRYAVVIEYPHLLHAANSDDILQKLLIDLNNLLDDREPEVRLAAAKILSKMFSKEHPEHVENFFTESMWERIENLITNSDSDMGSTMVEQIGKISLILSDHQYKENFIPLLERVLKNTVRVFFF
uniref:Serine/threonine-protein phosphatase 2A 65 kDa regulatory subunit A beta isoform (Trinotate prediction) n=1 Tax=Henneguya salminicola TaxID=69463 RepID=A0A6G3MDY0_HENSL